MDNAWKGDVFGELEDNHTRSLFQEYLKVCPDLARPNDKQAQLHVLNIQVQTRSLRQDPHQPFSWCDRAKSLMKLRYPELACSDCYKCSLLLDTTRQARKSALGARVLTNVLQRRYPGRDVKADVDPALFLDFSVTMTKPDVDRLRSEAGLLGCQALFFSNSFQECIDEIEQLQATRDLNRETRNLLTQLADYAQRGLQEEKEALARELIMQDEIDKLIKHGTIKIRNYPWMKEDMLRRSLLVRKSVLDDIEKLSDRRCSIKQTAVAGSVSLQMGDLSDYWGIFAKKHIVQDSKIFSEETSIASVTPSANRCKACCGLLHAASPFFRSTKGLAIKNFCSHDCEARGAFSDYVNASRVDQKVLRDLSLTMSRDLESVGFEAETAQEMLKFRMYQTAVFQAVQKSVHPLLSHPISILTTSTPSWDIIDFSFKRHIKWPMMMLQGLGVDYFQDHDFDAWVLLSLERRIKANAWEAYEDGRLFLGISPLYSLFNHSCDPNITWSKLAGSSTLQIVARRAIERGEELCISYIREQKLELSVEERAEKLKPWFAACNCQRCVRERCHVADIKLESESDEDIFLPCIPLPPDEEDDDYIPEVAASHFRMRYP